MRRVRLRVSPSVYQRLSKLPEDKEVWGYVSGNSVHIEGEIGVERLNLTNLTGKVIDFVFHTHPRAIPPFPSLTDIVLVRKLPMIHAIIGYLKLLSSIEIKVATFFSLFPFSLRDEREVAARSIHGIHFALRPLSRIVRVLHPNPLSDALLGLLWQDRSSEARERSDYDTRTIQPGD